MDTHGLWIFPREKRNILISFEKHNKKLFIVTVDPKETAKEIKKKLRLDNNLDNVKVVLVDPNTRSSNESLWFDHALQQLG